MLKVDHVWAHRNIERGVPGDRLAGIRQEDRGGAAQRAARRGCHDRDVPAGISMCRAKGVSEFCELERVRRLCLELRRQGLRLRRELENPSTQASLPLRLRRRHLP